MTKFTVISDTHGKADEKLTMLLSEINSGKFLIHLGDGANDIDKIADKIKCEVYKVGGNCDFGLDYPTDIILETEAGKILFTHGHTHSVRYGDLTSLYFFALQNDCVAAFYDHTHVAYSGIKNSVVLVNPGSLGEPRSLGASFCSVTIEHGILNPKIVLF